MIHLPPYSNLPCLHNVMGYVEQLLISCFQGHMLINKQQYRLDILFNKPTLKVRMKLSGVRQNKLLGFLASHSIEPIVEGF